MADKRRALLAEQKKYVAGFGERVIGYGHFVSDDGRDTLGTSFFMQLDDRAAADKFLADEPMNKAGVYARVDINRWSNSFGKRAADYRRKGMQQFLCTGPKTGTNEFFRDAPARARELLRVVWRELHLPRADPLGRWRRQHRHRAAARIAGPRCGRTSSGTRSRFRRTAAMRATRRSCGGCSATERQAFRHAPSFRGAAQRIRLSNSQGKKVREAERREAQHLVSAPCGAARALRQRARLPALHRGDFGLRDRTSGTRTASSSPARSRGFRPVRPVPSSPCGQSPVVGADGDPRPPGSPADEAGRAGAAPHSANKRHRLTPSNEQGGY